MSEVFGIRDEYVHDPIGNILDLAEYEAGRNAARDFLHREYVYFVVARGSGMDGTPIKIGWTLNPKKRLTSLQSQHFAELRLLLAVPGSRAMEASIHGAFVEDHIRGEWFRSTPKLRKLIAALDNERARVA